MVENDTWALGSARANVVRWGGATMVQVDGVVTAQAYEALHLRLSMERQASQVSVMLDWDALLAATNQSAAEAAFRGAGARRPAGQLRFLVPEARLQWARLHCAFMSKHGLPCSASLMRAHRRSTATASLAA